MNTEQLANLSNLIAMLILITTLIILQRKIPRITINSWLAALFLVLASQISWYFSTSFESWYPVTHTFRLCADLLAGMAFLLFIGETISIPNRATRILSWNAGALVALEVLYGTEIRRPLPYFVCSLIGAIACVVVAKNSHRRWIIPTVQLLCWFLIAAFSFAGNYRAAAYWGLGAAYTAAAIHLWFQLRRGTVGHAVIVAGLGIWATSFFAHPWIFNHPHFRALAENIWSMQKFFVTIGMLIVLLEEEALENEYLATHDQLTGLGNRRAMEKSLHAAIASGYADIILIDLDGFKEVNDSLGHHSGDSLLRSFAIRLIQNVEPEDVLVRLGGDEFLVITKRNGEAFGERLCSLLQEPFLIEGAFVSVGVSVGTASFPRDTEDSTERNKVIELLRIADRRMYALKNDHKSNREPRHVRQF